MHDECLEGYISWTLDLSFCALPLLIEACKYMFGYFSNIYNHSLLENQSLLDGPKVQISWYLVPVKIPNDTLLSLLYTNR